MADRMEGLAMFKLYQKGWDSVVQCYENGNAPTVASKGAACPKCGGALTKARGLVSAGYQFACLACDEDFYTIEIKGGI